MDKSVMNFWFNFYFYWWTLWLEHEQEYFIGYTREVYVGIVAKFVKLNVINVCCKVMTYLYLMHSVSHMTKEVCFWSDENGLTVKMSASCWYVCFMTWFVTILTGRCAIYLCSADCSVNRYDCSVFIWQKVQKCLFVVTSVSVTSFASGQ